MDQSLVMQQMDQALDHHRAGRLAEATRLYRQVLEADPDNPDAVHLLGFAMLQGGSIQEAIEIISRAVELCPDAEAYHANLGAALMAAGRIDEAIAAHRRAIELNPDFLQAWHNLTDALHRQGNFKEAIAAARRVVELTPAAHEAHLRLGDLLSLDNQVDEAATEYRIGADLNPSSARAHNRLGTTLLSLAQLPESVAEFDRAMALAPADPAIHSNKVFALHFHPDYDGPAILREARQWDQKFGHPQAAWVEHANDRDASRPLRVGYLSPNFRTHCQAFFTVPLLAHHDKKNLQIYCYSDSPRVDEVTDRLRSYADQWHNFVGMSHDKIAERIRADQIDILVDLTLHLSSNRLPVFALRPAPVQISWLGYTGTTGMSAIPWRLTDPYLDPPGMNEDHYSETCIRLPDTFWCYDPLTRQPPVSPPPAQENGFITFGCLNGFSKINAYTLDLWSLVLSARPTSKMILLAPPGRPRQRVLDHFARRAVAPGRIEFVDFQPRPLYLKTYQRIDIGLDALPANGHTTSLDSFWMGVPVITRIGRTAVGRAGFSQLSNLGLTELAAETDEQFARIATDLAGDLPRLAHLRKTLRQRLSDSPLMDAPKFARGVEAAYRHIWRQWTEAR